MFDTKIAEILKDLKENYGAVSLKSEFAEEGACYDEVAVLKNIADNAGLDYALKIGGCEAKKDMADAIQLNVKSIVAPMIESAYALKKFIKVADNTFNNKRLFINIETIDGYNNIDNIINSEEFDKLTGVVFGRSDFAGSLNLTCKNVNDEVIFNHANEISKKIKQHNKEFIIGGNISHDSISFLRNISYLSKFETRKIIFDASALKNPDINKGILLAIEFEILWIKNKNNGNLTEQDKKRIELLTVRCK